MTTVVCIETYAEQATITSEDVDTRWPFRAGYPRLLRPSVINLPINEAKIPIPNAKFEDLKSRIDSILKTYNIRRGVRSHDLVYRRQRYGKLGLPRVVVDCTYDKKTSHSKMWAKAVIEIYAATQSMVEGNIEVGVELFDWQYMLSTHICTCPPDKSKDLLANWETGNKYLEKILQLFREEPYDMFQAMTPVGRCSAGQRECEWSIVIFFDAIDAEDEKWDSIEDSIRSILPNHIGIEIQQRAGSLLCNSDDGDTQQSVEYDQPSWVSTMAQKYKEDALPGCKIGPQGRYNQGTMGGYVITQDKDGKRTTYGVTNAHVVFERDNVTFHRVPAEVGIKVQTPTACTQDTDIDTLRVHIATLEESLQALRAIRRKGRDTRRAIEIKEQELTWYRAHLHLISEDRCIGVVQNLTKGCANYSLSEPLHGSKLQTMDIALITMNCKQPWDRPLMESAKDPMIPKGMPYHTWEGDYLGSPMNAEQHIKVVAKLGKGVYTMGVVSEFVAFVRIRDTHGNWQRSYTRSVLRPPQFQMVKGTGVEVNDLTRLEEIFLKRWEEIFKRYEARPPNQRGEVPSLDDITPPAFSEKGDSGAFVIASTTFEYGSYFNRVAMPSTEDFSTYANVLAPMPFVVGMVWGSSKNAGVSFIVPFDAVKQEVEKLTGETMVWPQKRTEYLRELEQDRLPPVGENVDVGVMDES